MSVRPETLENPERGLEISTREAKPPRKREEHTAETRAFLDRLKKARDLKPIALHWWECWRRGRDAAIATIEADGDTLRARTIVPPAGIDCRACFQKGRDAAIEFIEET